MRVQNKRERLRERGCDPRKVGTKKIKSTQKRARVLTSRDFLDFFVETKIVTVSDDVNKCNFWRFREMVGYIGIAPAFYLRQHTEFESRHLSKIRKWST
jgi:hypothetical protein